MKFAYTNFLKNGEVWYQKIWIAETEDALKEHISTYLSERESSPEEINQPLENILREIVIDSSLYGGSLRELERYFAHREKVGIIGIVRGKKF